LQREARLNAKGYSERDEKRILDALGRGLLKEFPNPDRAGCPSSDVLKRIASHAMPLTEAENWLDHLTSCSPCYGDFFQFQAAYQRRRTRTLLAIAASILVVVCLAGWAFFLRRNESLVVQTVVLDLRNRSIPRSTDTNPAEPPLEVSHAATRWEIYLPLGSSDGSYNLRITTPKGDPIFTGGGVAKVQGGVTMLRTDVNLASASRGVYVLQLQSNNSGWSSYGLILR
jgi:hypothetical protein